MNILKATKRIISTTGQINKLRFGGSIPAILYGGKKDNMNISLKKLQVQDIIKSGSFMSKAVNLDIDGESEKVLPRDISYHPLSDEPIHIDFMRIVKGSILTLEIPVKFINQEDSPGLKKGGVLNTVRRKIELKCPAENIPDEITIDLADVEIGTSIKISAVKLPENVFPSIMDRDFVIATVVSPTVVVEPEKIEETTEDGATPAEKDAEGEAKAEGETKQEDGKEKSEGDKNKTTPSNKDQTSNKTKDTKKK